MVHTSVTTRFINKWTSDIRKEREKTRNEEILDLYLEGWTEAEIGKKLTLSRPRVTQILIDVKKGINSQINIPDPPQEGDVWLFTNCDDDYGISGFPGRIPGQIVENLLHFYTKPFDKVVDSMAGSGTTMDVCKVMYRRCLAYDIKPTKEEYSTAFQRLELIEGAIHWWYGDLALSYEGHYGAIVEIAEESGFDYGTIRNDKWVASRYELSYRYDNLTFKHHQITAPLED